MHEQNDNGAVFCPVKASDCWGEDAEDSVFLLLFVSERSFAKAPTVYPILGEKAACAAVSLHLHIKVPATAVAVCRLRGFL